MEHRVPLETCIAVARNQNLMNERVNSEWLTAGYPFYRALWREAGESIDHLGWEWWKKSKTDAKSRQQFHLELADMLHFGISIWLATAAKSGDTIDEVINDVGAHLRAAITATPILQEGATHSTERIICAVEDVVESALKGYFAADRLLRAALYSGLPPSGLMALYFGKNVLNHFRQNNGYKDGSYIKNWAVDEKAEQDIVVEDNVILYEILTNPDFGLVGAQDIGSDDYRRRLHDELTRHYKPVLHHHGRIPAYSQEK